MSKNTSIALSDHFSNFLTRQVQSGHYGSASEVVRAGLRLLEEYEAKMERLRAEIQKGIDSGDPLPFEPERWREEWKREWDAEQAAHADRPVSRRA